MPTTQRVVIRPPVTPEEFERYYELRYKVLRMPLGMERDTASDRYDNTGIRWHLAAFVGDTIVGVARMRRTKNRRYVINWVAVDPNQRRHGLGRILITTAEKIAINEGATAIELTSRNTARGFYRKLGYVDIGEAPPIPNLSGYQIQTGQTYMKKEL